ncbi:MAG: Fe-S cluster assembly protein SufB, partial [Halobacteria archaeon]|nr:Fe-S cluster assembly protein SufB [Halobacteria archaeon]
MSTETKEWKQAQKERFDHRNPERSVHKTPEGLSEEVIREISEEKDEPDWMLERRLKSFEHFKNKPMPDWGPSLHELDIESIVPYLKADETTNEEDWEEVPDDIKDTFDKLGIPEAEQEALGGVGAQY